MLPSMGVETPTKGHRERTPLMLAKESAHCTASPSTKSPVAAWLKSMIPCSPSPPTWRSFYRRSRSSHQNEQAHQLRIEAWLSTIRHHDNSQISIAKSSSKDSVEATPSGFIDSVGTGDMPVESLTIPGLYVSMPYSNSIRLLRLYKGAPSDPVEVNLEFARLDDTTPEYEALSYVWGSSISVSCIIYRTTQTPVPVTRNLYDALKGMRKMVQDRVIWVDAICINQSDEKEKGTQVRMMDSIYACAARVLVWLGADDAGDAAGAFSVLCSLANTEGESAHYETRSHEYAPFVPERVVKMKDCESWRKVMMFFCQVWFTRLWVLQEIVLAQDALFIWGDCSLLWRYVGRAVEGICKNELAQSLLHTKNLQNAFFMWHLSTAHHNAKRSGRRNSDQQSLEHEILPFLHLLDLARSFEVTDPRDKIYSLLGFPTIHNGSSARSILPDYTLSASQVYTNVTRNFLVQDQSLNILALVLYTPPDLSQTRERVDDLPSWVPNFDSKATVFPISNMNVEHQYSTGLFRHVCMLASTRPWLLHLEGTVLDTIRDTGPSIPFVQPHEIAQYTRPLIQWYIDAGISAHTLATTLTAGRTRDGHLLNPRQKENWMADLSRNMKELDLDTSAIPTKRLGLDCSHGLKSKEAMSRFITYRQPFVTQTGRFGLGPQGMKAGDTIAVLWGGQCPFVISVAGRGRWILKGECFVEEWMDGDAVAELVRKEGKRDTVFEFI